MFKKFRSGDFSLKDDQHSGRPSEVDDDIFKAIIESNRHITLREIAKQLNVSHATIENHIRYLGLVIKNGSSTIMLIEKDHDEPAQSISKAQLHHKKNMLSTW